MKQNKKKNLWMGIWFLLAFLLWTALIRCVDVQAVGPNGTRVGFSAFNLWFHHLTGVHMTIYTITDWLGLVPIAVCLGFGVVGVFQLIRNRSFARLQFQSLHIRPELFEDYYRDTCQIKKSDMVTFMKASTAYALKDTIRSSEADVHVYYGGKEPNEIKRSAELIGNNLPASQLHCFRDFYHGEFSINHAQDYADTIRQMLVSRQ